MSYKVIHRVAIELWKYKNTHYKSKTAILSELHFQQSWEQAKL